MAERLRRAAAWLGLVTDDRYADYDEQIDDEPTEGIHRDELLAPPDRRVEHSGNVTPLEPRRTGATATATAIRPRTADVSRIITVHPRTYNEARTIGEHFRDGVPVIMNLSEMEDVDAKRLVDFAAGLAFALRGSIDKVTNKVFLLSPPNIDVTAEDRRRLAEGGFLSQG
jgi:cell division inhibitor SepF